MRTKIGVIGSATGPISDGLSIKAREIGEQTASRGCILVTGAGMGLPYEAARGASSRGGYVVGISPAANEAEHVTKYAFPLEHFDLIIYTGFGLKGRNVVFVRTCDCLIVVSGRIGTLNEFTIAYDEGKSIGVLTGSGGISEMVEHIVQTAGKERGEIIFDSDPSNLVQKIVDLSISQPHE